MDRIDPYWPILVQAALSFHILFFVICKRKGNVDPLQLVIYRSCEVFPQLN